MRQKRLKLICESLEPFPDGTGELVRGIKTLLAKHDASHVFGRDVSFEITITGELIGLAYAYPVGAMKNKISRSLELWEQLTRENIGIFPSWLRSWESYRIEKIVGPYAQYIQNIAVDNLWRHLGIGKMLIKLMGSQARQADLFKQVAIVESENTQGLLLFKMCGFKQVERIGNHMLFSRTLCGS